MKPLKILSRIGLVLLIVVAAVLVIRAVLNYTEGRALARTLAELKARGVPVTAKELAPPCADEDNAARLWKAFENTVTMPGPPAPPLRRRPVWDASVTGPLGRAWGDHSAGRPVAPADRAAIRDAILKNRKAFEFVAAMTEKPCFLYRDPSVSLVEGVMPFVAPMIQTTKLLFFSALFSAEDGDMRGALDTMVIGLRFSPLAAGEGSLIPYLISVAETRIFSQFLAEVCGGRPVDEADLVRLMSAQDPAPWPERLARAFRGERVAFIEYGGYFQKASLHDLGSVFEAGWPEEVGLWVIRPLVKRDIRRALPEFEFYETQAQVPYYQSREVVKAHAEQLKKRPWYAFASRALISDFETIYLKEAQIEAIMLASRAGLACRLYKIRAGRYPESLDELVPALLPEVPVDPFTGKPLVYRRDGEGFIVYSLGSNQKDDGGRMTYEITQLVMDKDDDWSWREDR